MHQVGCGWKLSLENLTSKKVNVEIGLIAYPAQHVNLLAHEKKVYEAPGWFCFSYIKANDRYNYFNDNAVLDILTFGLVRYAQTCKNLNVQITENEIKIY